MPKQLDIQKLYLANPELILSNDEYEDHIERNLSNLEKTQQIKYLVDSFYDLKVGTSTIIWSKEEESSPYETRAATT